MKRRNRFLSIILFLLTVSIIASAVILFNPTQSPAAPTITWTPSSIEETLSPGESKVVSVVFTSSKDIDGNVTVRVVPELEPYIQVEPAQFSGLNKDQVVDLSIIISVSNNSSFGSYDGTVQLRYDKKNLAKPLPVIVNVWQSFTDEDLDISAYFPPTYDSIYIGVADPSLGQGQGYNLAIFRYIANEDSISGTIDAMPVKGCTIYIGIEGNPNGLSLSEWLLTHSYSRPDDIDEEIQVDEIVGLRRTGHGDIFGDPFTAVFIPYDNAISTITMDAHGKADVIEQCQQEFDQILNSFRFGN